MLLTYLDRELFLEIFRGFAQARKDADAELLREIKEVAARIEPRFGFESGLARDLLTLSDYLARRPDDESVATIARGALAYVARADASEAERTGPFGLLDDAFIANYAVYEIRSRLGEQGRYSPPQLSPAERAEAEKLFTDLFGVVTGSDEELIGNAAAAVASLGAIAESGVFVRFARNVRFLSDVLSDPARKAVDREIARAALLYVVRTDDAIPDDLGLVGYLDDNFIAEFAVRLIDPNQNPWLELLDSTLAAWPFLGAIHFEEGGTGCPASEFMLVNAALACPQLRHAEKGKYTTLIVPRVGPIPFLVGFLSALGLVHEALQNGSDQRSFRAGQKVRVDYDAVRVFHGYRTENGRQEFGLELHRKEKGLTLKRIDWWPISELKRLVPAESGRMTRGRTSRNMKANEAILGALEFVFSSAPGTAQPEKQVILAAQLSTSRDLAESLMLFGQRLSDALPTGHLNLLGEVERWSPRFGTQAPVLLVVPDLDRVVEYAEEHSAQIGMVIVDGTGRNASRAAGLARLKTLGVPTMLVVGPQEVASLGIDEEADVPLWEWSEDDLKSVMWPPVALPEASGRVEVFEKRLAASAFSSVDVQHICHAPAHAGFQAVSVLQSHADARGETIEDLDELLSLSFSILFGMVRYPFDLRNNATFTEKLSRGLAKIYDTAAASRYLSADERRDAVRARDALAALLTSLVEDNPKATALDAAVRDHPGCVLLAPSGDRSVYALSAKIRCVSIEEIDAGTPALVVPGWFGKDKMRRVLSPPAAPSVVLLLYDFEHRWYSGFRQMLREAAVRRAGRSARRDIFPSVRNWMTAPATGPDAPADEEVKSCLAIESLTDQVQGIRRRKLLHHASSDSAEDDVRARFLLFEGGSCAFLADNYKAKVATRLVERTSEKSSQGEDLEVVPSDQLKAGDYLLFLRGSDHDVIRVSADQLLRPGHRALSQLWKAALRTYVAAEGIPVETLRSRLDQQGCRRGIQAIRTWLYDDLIAPMNYERDVRIIAELTRDQPLCNNLDACVEAIRDVRGAHLRASFQLSCEVIERTVEALRTGQPISDALDIGNDIVLVRIAEIDRDLVGVRRSLVNRLLEGDEWHA